MIVYLCNIYLDVLNTPHKQQQQVHSMRRNHKQGSVVASKYQQLLAAQASYLYELSVSANASLLNLLFIIQYLFLFFKTNLANCTSFGRKIQNSLNFMWVWVISAKQFEADLIWGESKSDDTERGEVKKKGSLDCFISFKIMLSA